MPFRLGISEILTVIVILVMVVAVVAVEMLGLTELAQ